MNEPQKRRGRPRVPEEERKRHTLTFRMRGDLRDAVEELAEANGRTLSEQVEYYVDAAVFSEASLIYQYSTDAMSPTIQRCIASRISDQEAKEHVNLSVEFPAGHREMLTIQGQTCLKHPHTGGSLPWARAPGGKEDAVATARAMLAAIRKGAVDALVATLGSEAVETALAEDRKAAFAVEAQAALSDLGRSHATQIPSPTNSPQEGDHSLAALVSLIGGMTRRSPDLSALWSSSWPRTFANLPADTRSALIGALKDDASFAYETLMRPPSPTRIEEPPIRPSPQGIQLGALRKMQHALLPHRDDDDGEDFWGDEDGPARA